MATREAAIATAKTQMDLWNTGPLSSVNPIYSVQRLLAILTTGIDSLSEQHTLANIIREEVWDNPFDEALYP